MTDQVPKIDEIDNVDKLEAYLATQPIEVAQIVAFRCALRILPFSYQAAFLENDIPLAGRLRVSAFRALFLCWVDLRYRNKIFNLQLNIDAAAAAADSSDVAAHNASLHTAALTLVDGARVSVRAAASATHRVNVDPIYQTKRVVLGTIYAVAERPIVWRVIRRDLSVMMADSAEFLLQSSLWIGGEVPERVKQADSAFWKDISALGVQWRPIWDWYSNIKDGRIPFENLGRRFENVVIGLAKEGNDFWDRNPDEVMQETSDRLGLYQQKEQFSLDAKSTSNNIDFFISYSTKNETSAREINCHLEDAGYSTIAQFKDFPVGSNFVIEMQDGLERGARAIALLSPDYVASDHCRAEWAAIYNMDPIGKRRKLVSFLLEPTELNKLQRQIVYSSLIGLKQDARRKAVLDAVRHVVELVTPDQLKQKLADIVSPDVTVTADGKIDVTPNAKYDLAVNSPDLPDLPTSLRALCTIIEASLPENSPKTIAPTLQGYRGHLEERGANPAVGFLGMLVAALTKEFESADFEFWGSGLNEHFESFFACHSKFLGHFPRSGEREQAYAEAEIDEDEASGDDLIQPVQSVADAVEELKTIGKVTPGLERVVQGQVQIAKDVSSLPPNLSEDAGKGNVITPKRRFVLSQLGFWERMLAAVGSMTTLATTPQGQAAIAALREAIAKFLSLILL
ncbi:toll/interleukin-1 receptor domain-containing protein [Agrobacterium vitis]|uniref:toll/interleukin-1 receptor domain-containing protein n=1 Tax=Agrobacterium vitis TaxID=373 RepID=UPI003D26A37E